MTDLPDPLGMTDEDHQCCEVPFVEQLRSIKKDARMSYPIQWASDGSETGHQFIPVGYMMHKAADEITALRKRVEELKDYEQAYHKTVKMFHDLQDNMNALVLAAREITESCGTSGAVALITALKVLDNDTP